MQSSGRKQNIAVAATSSTSSGLVISQKPKNNSASSTWLNKGRTLKTHPMIVYSEPDLYTATGSLEND
ncbi:hypothetical protein PHLCEN_2v8929 [Hermanssonia centrifuga]|uniref:Uncharacterized protein n=1 Tax=Hermanssonia centrifuga TaxID=98765 RepID=A0A2R6NS73_9APHY|nr:hypothetical protein PHLCEN_2v8929 [Hermanssonia centrifuga]